MIAQAAQAAHENTLGYACHELRNPLHAISASAAFLSDCFTPGDSGYEDIQAIMAGALQMHRLVNDVLDLGKLRAGKLQLCPAPFPIRYVTGRMGEFYFYAHVSSVVESSCHLLRLLSFSGRC